jgi:hypothetical protein
MRQALLLWLNLLYLPLRLQLLLQALGFVP